MGTLTLYAIKSSLTLALLYLPYTLLLRKDTFFRLNRLALLSIVAVSLTVPCMNVPGLLPPSPAGEAITNVIMLPALVVGAVPLSPAEGDAVASPRGEWVEGLYLIGILAVLAWKTIGLVRLLRFIPSGCLWTDRQEQATIYCHAGRVSPFSWMRSVVIGEADAQANVQAVSPACPSPVLTHELAHVRLLHSWDVLFLSLAEALQWFNPCVWMLDASLREVHEYEADDAVLRRGVSAHSYQLLLIEKAVAGSRYHIANAFNHSLLKNRITMMTRKKSPRWARLKVLYAVPLTLIAIAVMASPQIEEKMKPLTIVNGKRVTEAEVKQLDQKQIAHVEVLKPETATKVYGVEEGKDGAVLITTEEGKRIHVKPGTLRLVVDGQEMTEHEAVKAVQGKEIKETVSMKHDGSTEVLVTTSESDDQVYDKPEVLPEYPGGTNQFWGYLREAVKYPKEALEWGVQGRIHVEFVVEKDGSITNTKVIKGAGELKEIVVTAYKPKNDSPEEVRKENEDKGRIALQEEALRVVRAMPRWKPGTVGGKPVRTKFVLPIVFRLS